MRTAAESFMPGFKQVMSRVFIFSYHTWPASQPSQTSLLTAVPGQLQRHLDGVQSHSYNTVSPESVIPFRCQMNIDTPQNAHPGAYIFGNYRRCLFFLFGSGKKDKVVCLCFDIFLACCCAVLCACAFVVEVKRTRAIIKLYQNLMLISMLRYK